MKEISEALSDAIFTVCNKVISKAKFDKTYKCRVVSKIDTNKYLIIKDNVEHVAYSNFEYNANDIVTVLLPQNDWANATIVYPQKLDSKFVKLDNDILYTWESVNLLDTRNDNNTPEWYFSTHARKMIVEFKFCRVIGLTTVEGQIPYTPLITIIPWGDSSGGYPRQMAWSGTTMYHRVGTSATEWSDWIALG